MSKERARRREAREAQAAAAAHERARAAARLARREAARRRLRGFLGPLLPGRPTGRQTGILAQRRRVRLNLILASLFMLQVLVWVVRPDWQARFGAALVACFAFPVIAAFTL